MTEFTFDRDPDYEGLPVEMMGERPDIPRQATGIDNYAHVLARAIMDGEITAQDAYAALDAYADETGYQASDPEE